MITIFGIDPGLTESTYAGITKPNGKFNLRYQGTIGHPSSDLRTFTWDPLLHAIQEAQQTGPVAVAVEDARGFIATGRNPDTILRNAEMSGVLQGYLTARTDAPVVSFPASGDILSWRSLIGADTCPPRMDWDEYVRFSLQRFMLQELPKQSHTVDATGIAVAVLERTLLRKLDPKKPDYIPNLYKLNALEAAKQTATNLGRAVRREQRRFNKK